MATITIKNVPNEIVDEVGSTIQYSDDFKFLGKKRKNNEINEKVVYWDDEEINNLGKNSLITSKSF